MIGKVVNQYRILDVLGSGGMGIVYRAEDMRLKRQVALKFLHPQMHQNEELKHRFLIEARTASVIQHPNVCTIYEINETESKDMYISMALYKGQTLRSRLADGYLSEEETLGIGIQIAKGLSKACSESIIHRDIKPANIMITDDGTVVIMDFGLAKLIDHTDFTRTGTTLGTINYMSPEQTQGLPVNHQTDIWSLGVMLYEMLTGKSPFEGDSIMAIMYAILHKEPVNVRDVCPWVSPRMSYSVHKALQKDLEKRYQNVRLLLSDLEEMFEALKVQARKTPGEKSRSISVQTDAGYDVPTTAPTDKSLSEDRRYRETAEQYYWKGDFENSITYYSQSLGENPNGEDAWIGQIRCFIQMKRFMEAQTWMENALSRLPDSPELIALRGVLASRMMNEKDALEFVEKALAFTRTSVSIWIARGECLLKSDRKEAELCFQRARALDRDNWRVSVEIGDAYYSILEYKRSAGYYLSAVKSNPNSPLIWFLLGKSREKAGLPNADEAYHKALELRPDWEKIKQLLFDRRAKNFFDVVKGWFNRNDRKKGNHDQNTS